MSRPRFRSVLAVAALGAAALTSSSAQAIVNGTTAQRSDYPAFTIVGAGCGGALIAPDRVLTAAHCLEVVAEDPTVQVGPKNERRAVRRLALNPTHVKEQAKVQREFPPPPADLMLLELDKPVTDVAPIAIATPADNLLAPGTPVVTIGRGSTSATDSSAGAGVFRSGTVAIQAPPVCADQLDTAIARAWGICTRDPRSADKKNRGPFTSACFGDSGGPLLAGPAAARRVLGVVSWGPSCGSRRDPEIYASAVAGRGWALAPADQVAWAPQAIGRARLAGTPAVGRTVTCVVKWLVKPTKNLEYAFVVGGFQKQAGARATYKIPSSAKGKTLACSAGGATAGGRGGPPGLSPAVTVR